MTSFLGELRRRNVFKVAVAYAIVGWLLAQLAEFATETFGAPAWVLPIFVIFVLLGLPVALILSWAYELTPDGMTRTEAVPATDSITPATGRKLDRAIIGLLVLAVGFLLARDYLPDTVEPEAVVQEADPLAEPAEEIPALADAEERDDRLANSVAVLPFDNLSPDPNDAYFAAGIHEEILNALVKLQNLSVISRTSVVRYADSGLSIPEIAEELNVETVMEGSVRYAGDRVRITAQLIDAATDEHLWSDAYERDFADVFGIQADIAMNIANAMEVEFSSEQQASIEEVPTESPEAYALFLRAVATLVRSAPAEISALDWSDDLDRAIAFDPNFALAYAVKGWSYAVWAPTTDWESVAEENAERALMLDPTLVVAHVAHAVFLQNQWRWTEAQEAFERAYGLNPNDINVLSQYLAFLRTAGDYAEATRLSRRYVQLDPNGYDAHLQLGISYRYAGDFDAAVAALRTAREMNPSTESSHALLAQAEAMRGNADVALHELQIAEELGARSAHWRLAQMALVNVQIDRREAAAELLAELEERSQETLFTDASLALAYLALAQYEPALQHLAIAVETRSPNRIALSEIKSNYWGDPVLDTDPRFVELREQIFAVN